MYVSFVVNIPKMVVCDRYNNAESSTDQDELTSEEIAIRKLAKSILLNQIFIATYQERRYVQGLNDYRDVVRIHNEETNLLKALKHVKKRMESYYQCWIGITEDDMIGAPVGTCIWVELPEQGKFGKYWFKIKSIKFKKNEIMVKVKILRDANTPDKDILKINSNPDEFMANVKENLAEMVVMTKMSLGTFLTDILTIENTKSALVYVSAVLVTIFIGFVNLVQYLGEYFLKLCRELSLLVKSLTPILIAFIDMIGKTFGSLFYLIFLLFVGNKRKPQPQATTYITYQPLGAPYNQRALPYHRTSSVRISEIN